MFPRIMASLRGIAGNADFALDLGTANTRLFVLGRGLIADQPSVLSSQGGSLSRHEHRAIGRHRNGHFLKNETEWPLRSGVIADFNAAVAMLRPLILRTRRFGIIPAKALVCAPTDATQVEREMLCGAVYRAGADCAGVVPEPVAAALGAGLKIDSPPAQMIVDIGEGVTDIAVIRSGNIVASGAVRRGCGDFHATLRQMVLTHHGILLYRSEVERLTWALGSPPTLVPSTNAGAVGVDPITGEEATVHVGSHEVARAIQPVLDLISKRIQRLLRELEDPVACEVFEGGMRLTGGGACLQGITDYMAETTGLTVKKVADPMHSVIDGAAQMLERGFRTDYWPQPGA